MGVGSNYTVSTSLTIDAETTLAALTYTAADHITRLGPFGEGNPRPVVAVRGARLIAPAQRMGRSGGTVSLLLGQDDARIRCVGFGMGDLADLLAGVGVVDVAGTPTLNRFQGRTSVEMQLKDVLWP